MPPSAAEMPPEEQEGEEPEEGEDDGEGGEEQEYATAGAAIREAFHAGDDAGLAQAICDLIDLHEGGGEEPEGEGDESKPNLAALLISKKRK